MKSREASTSKDPGLAPAHIPECPGPARGTGPTLAAEVPQGDPRPELPVSFLCGLAYRKGDAQTILPPGVAGNGAPLERRSSSGCRATPANTQSGAGETPSASSATSESEEGLGNALALARGRGTIRFELFGEAMRAMI